MGRKLPLYLQFYRILKSNSESNVILFEKPGNLQGANKILECLVSNRVGKINLELQNLHGEKLVQHELQWIVTISELEYSHLDGYTLAALRLDNRSLLSTAHDHLRSIMDMLKDFKRAVQRDIPCAYCKTSVWLYHVCQEWRMGQLFSLQRF